MPTFVPPRNPDLDSEKEVVPNFLEAKFGDQYGQTAGNGKNPFTDQATWTWPALTVAEADAIEIFMKAQQGGASFTWTAPRDSVAKLWRMLSFKRRYTFPNNDTITMVFREVFE